MKTSELIRALQKSIDRHGDLDMLVIWEGTTHGISQSSVFAGKEREYRSEDPKDNDVLYIDADENLYKQDFANDPSENELDEGGEDQPTTKG
jgi:hypothetical protein